VRSAALQAALLLAAFPPAGDEHGDRGPAPAAALGGLSGFTATSRVTLHAAPDDPHTLEVVMGFPDRARWTLRREETSDNRIEYRFGEHVFARQQDARESEPLPREDLGAYYRRQALRQAAFVWPEGAAWEGTGERREARIVALAGDPPEAAIGRLAAVLGADGRPRSIASHDASGRLEETLEIRGWKESGGRAWPAQLDLSAGGEPVWEETVSAVEAATRSDDFFVPANQRHVLRPYAAVERMRLERAVALRLPLAAGADWRAAREQADAARREREPELLRAGQALDPRTWIVLAEDTLAPVAVELRLLKPPRAPPQGFEERPPRDALRLVLGGLAPPAAADRDRLRAARPPGRRAEAWLATVGAGDIQLDCVLAP